MPYIKPKVSAKIDLQKPGHSQTVDWLRQTIRTKNEQISAVNKSIDELNKIVILKDQQLKSFESVALKLKDRCENSSEIVKKINQFNMYFLSFYKDFEAMVKEETRNIISEEDNKFKKLQKQLEVCMDIFNIESSNQWHINNQAVFKELQELMKENDDSISFPRNLNRKNSGYSKSTIDDVSNMVSCLSAIEKVLDSSIPTSNPNLSYKQISTSFTQENNMDLDQLREDLEKLSVESKYLKNRLNPINKNGLKCEICAGSKCCVYKNNVISWNTHINSLSSISNHLSMPLTQLTLQCIQRTTELEKAKEEADRRWEVEMEAHEVTKQEIMELRTKLEEKEMEGFDKMELESRLVQEVAELKEKNKEMNQLVKHTLSSKEGLEFLFDTVSDLSLALISKNEKDLSHKQIHLIKNLFEESQINAVNNFKKQIEILEKDKAEICIAAKQLAHKNKEILKPLRKYSIAVKEWIDIYTFLDASNCDFTDDQNWSYMNKHASEFISEYEEGINEFLPKISDITNSVKKIVESINQHVDYSENDLIDMFYESPSKSRNPIQDAKCLSTTETGPSDKIEDASPIENSKLGESKELMKEPFDYSAKKEISDFSNNNPNLLVELEAKDREILELKEQLNILSKSSKKGKKKITKMGKKTNKIKEKQEKMIQETLDELQMLVDDEDPWFDVCDPIPARLAWETDTINEADEKDEEETIFDKDGNIVLWRSLRSVNKEKDLSEKDHPFEIAPLDVNRLYHATISECDLPVQSPIDRYSQGNISLASTSVKFDGDLLNDSLKFEDNLI
jgi:hypothetical protein